MVSVQPYFSMVNKANTTCKIIPKCNLFFLVPVVTHSENFYKNVSVSFFCEIPHFAFTKKMNDSKALHRTAKVINGDLDTEQNPYRVLLLWILIPIWQQHENTTSHPSSTNTYIGLHNKQGRINHSGGPIPT